MPQPVLIRLLPSTPPQLSDVPEILWANMLDLCASRLCLQANADRAPALLDIATALAASPRLAPVLADSMARPAAEASNAAAGVLTPCPEPWASEKHLGTRCILASQ